VKTPLQPFEVLPPQDLAEEMKRALLQHYAACGTIKGACDAVGIHTRLAYTWKVKDPDFSKKWDEITTGSVLAHLEQVAIERAMEKSDLLIMFLMKSMNRKRYDDRQAVAPRDNELRVVFEGVKAPVPDTIPQPEQDDGTTSFSIASPTKTRSES
jgi:hypothetical protein